MTKRRVQKGETKVAGIGENGDLFGVITLSATGGERHLARKRPCKTCPWRTDQPVGRFPAEAYRLSAKTAYDAAYETFACHESGSKVPTTCAGFLLRNADNNIGVRLSHAFGRLDLTDLSAGGVELYENYRAMAIANGVAPDDPAIDPCRGQQRAPPGHAARPPVGRRRQDVTGKIIASVLSDEAFARQGYNQGAEWKPGRFSATGMSADGVYSTRYYDAVIGHHGRSREDAFEGGEDVYWSDNRPGFLRHIANQLWKLAPTVSGLDQSHAEGLIALAREIAESAPPLKPEDFYEPEDDSIGPAVPMGPIDADVEADLTALKTAVSRMIRPGITDEDMQTMFEVEEVERIIARLEAKLK